jgi:putative ABC transport system permease protein
MFANYIKTAFRSVLRHRFFSAINIFGLAVAMSICMAIIMLVADQLTYDRFNTKADRIYQLYTTPPANESRQPNTASPMRLKAELADKYTGTEQIVRLKRGFGNGWIEFENHDVNVPVAGFYADPEVFDLFEYEFQYGDSHTALKDPYTVVLTRKAADKLFKEENPLGLTIKVGKLGTFTVTGVLKETGKKSHIVFEALASMASVKSVLSETDYRNSMDDWTNYWEGWTYVLLEEGKTQSDIQSHLDKIYDEHIGAISNPGVYKMKFGLRPLLSITPGPMWNNSIGPLLPWFFIYFLGGLALIILLTSCFNFTNLSIARSLTRAREIGVRKVTGAMRWQIFSQFITESVLVALLALVLALALMVFIKPLILQLNLAHIFRWDLQINEMVVVVFIVFAAVVGILAGLFPAVVLSGFQPVKVLKSLNNLKLFSRMGLRKALLVSQFTLSLFFILTLIVIYNQLTLFINQDHGFNMRSNILVRLNNTSADALKNELLKYNNITSVSAASHVPAAGTSFGAGFKKKLDDPEWTNLDYFLVDENYVENMGIKLLAGSFFTEERKEANKDFIVINQAAARAFHFETELDAIDQEVIMEHDSSRRTIIGVVQNYNHNDLIRAIEPMALMYNPMEYGLLQVAYAGQYPDAAASIEKAWASVNPGMKVDYKEVEDEINQYYEIIFGDIVSVLGTISILAILISCLGLLGMATYATESRIKEISVRKILGSTNSSLVLLLSRGFLSMLAIAILLGVPAAYFLNNLWLNYIAYHTTLGVGSIGLGVLILVVFGVLTIGSQTIRATFVKPVDNLKSE